MSSLFASFRLVKRLVLHPILFSLSLNRFCNSIIFCCAGLPVRVEYLFTKSFSVRDERYFY